MTETSSSLAAPWQLPAYRIRRKVFKIFGASFHVYDGERVAGFCKQKAFTLREDVRVFADERQQHELMWIRARQVLDFAAFYDIVDSGTQQKLGALRRRGFKSIVRDSWEVLDDTDRPVARVEEDSAALALVRRFLTNLVPQTFHLSGQQGGRDAGGDRRTTELNPDVRRWCNPGARKTLLRGFGLCHNAAHVTHSTRTGTVAGRPGGRRSADRIRIARGTGAAHPAGWRLQRYAGGSGPGALRPAVRGLPRTRAGRRTSPSSRGPGVHVQMAPGAAVGAVHQDSLYHAAGCR